MIAPLWLITVHDKELFGEPDVAMCVVESDNDELAQEYGHDIVEELSSGGHGRCVARIREIERGVVYRPNTLIRTPRREP